MDRNTLVALLTTILGEVVAVTLAVAITPEWLRDHWLTVGVFAISLLAIIWLLSSRTSSRHPAQRSGWLSTTEALQYIYDELTSGRFNDGGQILQATKALGEGSNDLWDHAGPWLAEGLSKQLIIGEGLCEQRSQIERIPQVDAQWSDDAPGPRQVRDRQGLTWQIVRLQKRSIDSYLASLG